MHWLVIKWDYKHYVYHVRSCMIPIRSVGYSSFCIFSHGSLFSSVEIWSKIKNICKMASSQRKCLNSPDSFCYICGSFSAPSQRKDISDFVKRAYLAYFKIRLGDQDKSWAPHQACKTCMEHLRQWTKGTRDGLKFGIPVICREPKDHVTDYYFCIVKIA